MLVELPDDDSWDDCADEGVVLAGPASLLRALLDVEPALPAFSSALWRGLISGPALDHRAEALHNVTPHTG